MSFPPSLPPRQVPVFLDGDPGHDDFFSFLLALHFPENFRVLGISTTGGNQTVEKTTENTLKALESFNLAHIPVYRGREDPILRPAFQCEEIHGASGLDYFDSSEGPGVHFQEVHTKVRDMKAYDGIYHELVCEMKRSGQWDSLAPQLSAFRAPPRPEKAGDALLGNSRGVSIIATGPLTNVAMLLLTHPECILMLKEIVLMGGSIGLGNISSAAEFNILVDPEAAQIVFKSGLPIVMVPLEVTHTVLVTPQRIEGIRALGTPFASLLVNLLLFFQASYKETFEFESPPLHDPCAVFYLLTQLNDDYRDCMEVREINVAIECRSEFCDGRTICDWFNQRGKVKNCKVAVNIQVEKFWHAMNRAIREADRNSPINNKTP